MQGSEAGKGGYANATLRLAWQAHAHAHSPSGL